MPRYISNSTEECISRSIVFHLGLLASVRRTVGGVGGFEERRKGERFKLALPVQLNDGIGTTCDISTSGLFL